MNLRNRHLKNRGLLFLGIMVLLGTTYLTAREIFYRVYVLSVTQEMLNKIASVRIESIGSVKATLNGEVTIVDPEAFTYRNGERHLFYRAKSVTFHLNGFPGTTSDLRLIRVDLEEPEIYLRRDREGVWNISWALQPPPEEKSPSESTEQEETSESSFPPEGIRIKNGTIHIRIETKSGKTSKWSIEKVEGSLTKDDNVLQLHPMEGDFYGGRLFVRKAEFITSSKLQSKLQISITGASIERLSAPLDLKQPATGNLDAVFSFTTGEIRTGSHPIGAGRIEITDADLWEIPIFYQILSFLALDPIRERRIDTAQILFTTEKDRIRVDQMDFLGFPISLFGEGEMGLAGDDLEVAFIPRLGRKGLDEMLPLIGTPIQWLLDIAKGVFVPLILNGSFENPKISVKPGYHVAAPVRKLLESKER